MSAISRHVTGKRRVWAKYSPDFVRPLDVAENHFLQVLLSRFTLMRSGLGSSLSVHFDEKTPAIWTRHAKGHVQQRIPDFKQSAKALQKRLDAVLQHRTAAALSYDDPAFPFRYSSGGVLPILRMGDREYFNLFYRDIYPVGWNIANGGSDSRAEFLYPMTIVEREFREELIVLKLPTREDPRAGRRYVFNWEDSGSDDRPEYALARQIWAWTYPNLDVGSFDQLKLPIEWMNGPDAITVHMGDEAPTTVTGCFLNINALDFGIEIDKVARIYVDRDVVLLDGEIMNQLVLGRPLGLFDVDRMLREVRRGATKFIPEYFYYNGQKYDGRAFESTITETLTPSLGSVRTPEEINYFTNKKTKKYDLCPVTRSLVRRYANVHDSLASQGQRPAPKPQPPPQTTVRRPSRFEVFISCGQGDEDLAARVYEYVTTVKGKHTFFYRKAVANQWARELGDALESARCLILVGSDRQRLRRRWPEHEWLTFHNARLSGRKPRTAKLIPFIQGVDPNVVPFMISGVYRVVICEDLESGLAQLGAMMDSRS